MIFRGGFTAPFARSMIGIEIGSSALTIQHGRLSPVCPYCGRVHPETRRRVLVLVLLLVATLVAGMAPEVRAEPATSTIRRGHHLTVIDRSAPEAVPVATAPSTATPRPTAQPSPTPLPIPKTGIVWTEHGASVYFYAEPGQGILRSIPNGTFVTLLDEFASYGNLPWTQVQLDEKTGWLTATDVHRLRFEGERFSQVAAPEGTNLYTEPQGQIVLWLPPGTPVRFQESAGGWARVSALNGEVGWVLLDKLADEPLESR